MKIVRETITLLCSVLVVLAVVHTDASLYITQILAFIIIVSIVILVIKRKKNKEILTGSLVEVFGITTAILLTIFLTGSTNSPLFFLLYFLLFGIAFLMEPNAVFLFLVGIIILFVPEILPGIDITELARMGGLILISPIAYFFGREFQRRERLEKEIENTADKIIEEAESVKNSNKLEDEINTEVDEIIEDASELKKTAQNE